MYLKFIVFQFIFWFGFDSDATNTSTTDIIVYVVRSKYEEWMNLANTLPNIKDQLDQEISTMRKKYGAQLQEGDRIRNSLYLQVRHQKVNYEKRIWQQRHHKNGLIFFKLLTLIKTHIDEYERLPLNFSPNMELVNKSQSLITQIEEIRRQRWDHILEKYVHIEEVKNLTRRIVKAAIQHSEFSVGVAQGYKLLLHYLNPKELHTITPIRWLPDFNNNITGNFEVDKCFIILMHDLGNRTASNARSPGQKN